MAGGPARGVLTRVRPLNYFRLVRLVRIVESGSTARENAFILLLFAFLSLSP